MSLYRVSSTWTHNVEGRKEAVISRLKARIRMEAEKEERRLELSGKKNVREQ